MKLSMSSTAPPIITQKGQFSNSWKLGNRSNEQKDPILSWWKLGDQIYSDRPNSLSLSLKLAITIVPFSTTAKSHIRDPYPTDLNLEWVSESLSLKHLSRRVKTCIREFILQVHTFRMSSILQWLWSTKASSHRFRLEFACIPM